MYTVNKQKMIDLLENIYPPIDIDRIELTATENEILDKAEMMEARGDAPSGIELRLYGETARTAQGYIIDWSDCVEAGND